MYINFISSNSKGDRVNSQQNTTNRTPKDKQTEICVCICVCSEFHIKSFSNIKSFRFFLFLFYLLLSAEAYLFCLEHVYVVALTSVSMLLWSDIVTCSKRVDVMNTRRHVVELASSALLLLLGRQRVLRCENDNLTEAPVRMNAITTRYETEMISEAFQHSSVLERCLVQYRRNES